MKWVTVGLVEGAVLVAVAAMISPVVSGAFIAGGAAEAVITYMQYAHAKEAGMASSEPGTETHG